MLSAIDPSPMSSAEVAAQLTPLLPRTKSPPHAHLIFYRLCHSPWSSINQRALIETRGFLAIYMTIILALELSYEILNRERGQYFIFLLSNFSYAIQTAYYWVTFIWTVQHYLTPHRRTVRIVGEDRGFLAKVKSAVSVPTTTDVNSKRHVTCSLLYDAAITLPFVTSIMYWLVLHRLNTSLGPGAAARSFPMHQIMGSFSFRGRHFRTFLLMNLNVVNSFIALVEIMALSSVRKQKPFGTHIVGILAITIVYLVWAGVLGHLITGKFVYKFLDPLYHGWTAVVLVVVGMLSLVTTMFFVQRGLHSWRERLSWMAECERQVR